MKILYLKIRDNEILESQLVDDFIGSDYKDYAKMKHIMYAFKIAKNIPDKVDEFYGFDKIKLTHNPSKTVYYIQLLDI